MGRVCRRQQGAGNGKSNRLVCSLLRDNADVRTLLVLTKPHTNKVMLLAKLLRDLAEDDCHAVTEKNKARIVTFHRACGARAAGDRVFFATVDSFMCAIGDTRHARGTQVFTAAVNSIVDNRHAQLSTWMPVLAFKGQTVDVRYSRMFVDEAQDLSREYLVALEVYADHTDTDVVLIGDALQSIQYEDNAMTCERVAFEEPPTNVCLRFGQDMARVVNAVVPHAAHGLPAIGTALTGGAVFVRRVPYISPYRAPDAAMTQATVDIVMLALGAVYESRVMLPSDLLVVSPRVRRDDVMDMLEMRMSDFWSERGYADAAYLHVSEPGHPVDLESSANATRLVSIHAAKGDDRPVVFVVGLTERALTRFVGDVACAPTESRVYASLLHVALTRAKEALYVFASDHEDDVTVRLRSAGLVTWKLRAESRWSESTSGVFHDRLENDVSAEMRVYLDSLIPREEEVAFAPAGVSDAVHHYVEYSCMVVGCIMHLSRQEPRPSGTLATLFDPTGAMRTARCARLTYAEYARDHVLRATPREVPIVVARTNAEEAEILERLVANVQRAPEPRCALEMSVVLYVIGHAVPNALDGTRGMYRPLTMYRVLRWFAQNPCAGGCGCSEVLRGCSSSGHVPCMAAHASRLANVSLRMERAMELVGPAVWQLDHRRPPPLSPIDAFPLSAHRAVLFRVATDDTEYVVHLHCRFFSDVYRHTMDALIDAMVQSRWATGARRAACLVVALDAREPIVVHAPVDCSVPLRYLRDSICHHYSKFNRRVCSDTDPVLATGPKYARGAPIGVDIGAYLDDALRASACVYVDAIPKKAARINVTEAACFLAADRNYTATRVETGFPAFAGDVRDPCAVGTAAPLLAQSLLDGLTAPDADDATWHAARAVVSAVALFCGGSARFEAPLADVHRHGRTLRGRVDAGGGGVFLEFKLNAGIHGTTHVRQMAAYLAMSDGGVGFVVGLHDAVAWRVVVTSDEADALLDAILG